MSPNAILYFVKYPEPGMVKTRLAKVVGDHYAAQAYRELTEINLGILNSLPPNLARVIIAFDPFEKEEAFRSWLSGPYEYVAQKGSELGRRLRNAFQFAFEKGFKKVMVLGSDTLGFRPDLIVKGFEALEFYDVVVGPAYDGGYYLIGMNSPSPSPLPLEGGEDKGEGVLLSIFKNIPWSSAHVFELTLNKLIGKNLSYYLLEKLDDLDEVKNLRGGKKHECTRKTTDNPVREIGTE